MRQTLLCFFLFTFYLVSFSQETDTTVVYEYDTVYLPADTIEQFNSAPVQAADILPQKHFSILIGFSGYNFRGIDQAASLSSTTVFDNSFSYDAGFGLRWVFSSLMIQAGLGINAYNENKTSTVFSHSDTSVNSDNPETKNTLMVYYTAGFRNRWICLNVPLMLGYSGQWKNLEYHAAAGITLGYAVSADIYYIDPATESLIKKTPADYRKFNEVIAVSAGAGYQMLPGIYLEAELGYRKMLSQGSMMPDRMGKGFPFVTIGLRKEFGITK